MPCPSRRCLASPISAFSSPSLGWAARQPRAALARPPGAQAHQGAAHAQQGRAARYVQLHRVARRPGASGRPAAAHCRRRCRRPCRDSPCLHAVGPAGPRDNGCLELRVKWRRTKKAHVPIYPQRLHQRLARNPENCPCLPQPHLSALLNVSLSTPGGYAS